MKFVSAILMIAAVTSPPNDTPPPENSNNYQTAYQKALKGDKPLLILVTATWCAPCQEMKAKTIPNLMSRDRFKGFHFATVDWDAEPKIAEKLTGGRGVPQLVVFEKTEQGKWRQRYLAGPNNESTIEEFLDKSFVQRSAAALAETTGR